MENSKAIKLIDKILVDLDNTGINTDTLINDIKELRTYAIEEEAPLVVKVLRYTYEHIEEHDSFLIPMLEDDDELLTEDGEVAAVEEEAAVVDPVESLKYVISLTRNLKNKTNIADLRAYKELLLAY
ncbi:hypothetical protein JJL45_07715 [Tamlana sp. s12]|uniref:hypothetical protein n=1 Tax=Flavobacteriaceae TaxID=49546 RepID=UPI0007FB9D8B|nr:MULTISPECIES: hypothetical protein [Tamlana]OBQ55477.1 hypothetical protein VQ01_08440 [Tamlana sp. s12]QQY83858.1 hypothetical protein JJL45_07715 [Tamlana sp. s12]